MSVTNLGMHHSPAWGQVRQQFGEWRRRVRSCQELAGLGDYELRDIGISRRTANLEVSKPFWAA
jgi:uncharacterized protein YjiS (DUF1127 family)